MVTGRNGRYIGLHMKHATSTILIDEIVRWLNQQALRDANLEEIARGTCDRLAAAGLPIIRANMSFSMLHPLYRAVGYLWERNKGFSVEKHRHVQDGEVDRLLKSPFYHLVKNDLPYLRRRIDRSETSPEFPIFEEFRAEGITDYFAFMSKFKQSSGQGMIGSWASDRAEGFSDDDIAALLRIQESLAVAAKIAVKGELAQNTLTTYLGQGAGERVLSGQIKRGDGETIKAAIVVADMRNSTILAEELGREAYISTLNNFFDGVATAFTDTGGEILSFVGDGFLAIYPSGETPRGRKDACRSAHQGALKAAVRMKEMNEKYGREGLSEIGYGIGLHIGNVMFGNVGLPARLAFSVFGAAVNEATRIEALTKTYKTPAIASEEFRSRCEGEWKELGSATLRGLSRPVQLFCPILPLTQEAAEERLLQVEETGRSDAENVVLLHQGGIQRERAAR
jgi:adenylate cyclase